MLCYNLTSESSYEFDCAIRQYEHGRYEHDRYEHDGHEHEHVHITTWVDSMCGLGATRGGMLTNFRFASASVAPAPTRFEPEPKAKAVFGLNSDLWLR